MLDLWSAINVRAVHRTEREKRKSEDRRDEERSKARKTKLLRRIRENEREGVKDTGKIEGAAERPERRTTPKGNLGATSMYHGS